MAKNDAPPIAETDAHPLLVAAVIVHDVTANQVLLIQRGPEAKFAPSHFDLPIGKAHAAEPIVATAVRELREETGLIVTSDSLSLTGAIHGAWGVAAPEGFLALTFATQTWTGDAVNAEPHKHSDVIWCPTGQIPHLFVPTTRQALLSYLNSDTHVVLNGFSALDAPAESR
ncbi:NUDIX domain-containing protein [Saccharopolyspora sp. ID03-671]|uniref:NUDIX domain-containing protein n=1 Tax=Saccharopolyspora sp. ID03-671 TaxID=3073066 RepID=UPI00324C226D